MATFYCMLVKLVQILAITLLAHSLNYLPLNPPFALKIRAKYIQIALHHMNKKLPIQPNGILLPPLPHVFIIDHILPYLPMTPWTCYNVFVE
jgi:hypothetical protein